MIEICKTCGRRKSRGWRVDGNRTTSLCRDETHVGVVAVTDEQASDLASAARAYNAAREIEDRAAAFGDWLAVLTDGLPAPAVEQMELS